MERVLRPIAAFALAGLVTVAAGFQLGEDGRAASSEVDAPLTGFGEPSTGHPLARLKILEPTLYHVEESYVEPGRIDWERMYVRGFEAVERQVPAFKFTRDGDRTSVEIDTFRSVYEVPRIGSARDLLQESRRIAALLQSHLDPAEVPVPPGHERTDPLAHVEYALVNGLLDTLDPHSLLLPPVDANEMDLENQGEFGGLGITIVERDGRLVVEHPMPDTPAWAAGILRDDVITRIDGHSTLNMPLDEAIGLLRGPVDTPVMLEIQRAGFDAPRDFKVVRKLIRLNEVTGELLDGDVGLIGIQSFHSNVERELHEVLTRLNRTSQAGLRGVVLDLRDNPGGYLNQAVAVSDTFLDAGRIVSTVDGRGRKQDLEEARPTRTTEPAYPVVVLVNANSASASEIVAGALRNNGRAVIVGERTFGKGSVQNLHQFYDESKLKLTISKYLTPGDKSIQAVGIPADIELVPVRIDVRSTGERVASVYGRERVRREADLDSSLERVADRADETAYTMRFLDERNQRARADRAPDFQVTFARDLILGAGSARRAEMLANASRIVDTYAKRGEAEIVAAMKALGLDWSRGLDWTEPDLPVDLTLAVQGGVIRAGERTPVILSVTNRTDRPLSRLGVLALDSEVLSGREFLIGRLAPGETRTATVEVNLVDGFPAELSPVRLSVRDGGDAPLGDVLADVQVAARPAPELVWSWRMADLGDGDGVAEVGEKVAIELSVENRGKGLTGTAFARLRNESGRALDLVTGTLEPGTLRDLSGAPCPTVSAATGCQLRLAPGETWSGTLEVELREARADGWVVELTLGDGEAYDHASVVRGGFFEHFTQKTRLVVPAGPLPGPTRRAPPAITLSRVPDLVLQDARATLSGLASDDTGVRHVMVFGAGDKLFYEGSAAGLRSVPFTADVPLSMGANVITVIARDVDGFVATRSVVAHRREPEPVASRTER